MTKRYETALVAYHVAVKAYDESHYDPRALGAAVLALDALAVAAPSPERHTPDRSNDDEL